MKLTRFLIIIISFVSFTAIIVGPVEAGSGAVFSGGDCNSYQACVNVEGATLVPGDSGCPEGIQVTSQGIICEYTQDGVNFTRSASVAPPQLRVLEFWFVRILYAIWAVAGIFFTIVLIWIGFQYMTSFGNEVALAEVVKKFRYWIIGMGLVFLSYPGLVTFFNVLAVDTSQDCYQQLEDQLIGFQFFFPNACGTTQSQNFNTSTGEIKSLCESVLVPGALLGVTADEFCSGVADGIVTNCISSCDVLPSGSANQECRDQCITPPSVQFEIRVQECFRRCVDVGEQEIRCGRDCRDNPNSF